MSYQIRINEVPDKPYSGAQFPPAMMASSMSNTDFRAEYSLSRK